MPRRNLAWLLAVPAFVLLGLVVGYSAPAPDKDYRLVRQIVDVLAEVDGRYVRELTDDDRKQLVEDMIDGGLRQLDPHSQYFNADQLKAFETSTEGSFGGIGVTLVVDPKSNLLKVESPMPGTPAYDAGIAAGDLITKVGDASTENMRVDEARKLITGEVGTAVKLTTARENRQPVEQDVTVTRAKIEVHPVVGFRRRADDPLKWDFLADGDKKIGYVYVKQFSSQTADEVKAALKQIEAAGGTGLVLDLRDDPGGLLTQAVAVADLFVPGGTIVSTKNRRKDEKVTTAKPAEKGFEFAEKWPVAVLINRGSASASEIAAACLQDHGRAVVVGERSYGKGSVQQLINLPHLPGEPPAAVKLTTETYWRPSGKNIHRDPKLSKEADEWGVKPDPGYEVAMTDEERVKFALHRRQQDFVPGKPGVEPAPKKADPKAKDDGKPFEDKVLLKALDYLRKKVSGVGEAPRPAAVLPAATRA